MVDFLNRGTKMTLTKDAKLMSGIHWTHVGSENQRARFSRRSVSGILWPGILSRLQPVTVLGYRPHDRCALDDRHRTAARNSRRRQLTVSAPVETRCYLAAVQPLQALPQHHFHNEIAEPVRGVVHKRVVDVTLPEVVRLRSFSRLLPVGPK